MFSQLERYIPLFENYLIASDQASFVNSLKDPTEKAFLSLLTKPIDSTISLREQIKKLNLGYQLQNQIEDYKLFTYIKEAVDLKDENLFQEIKRKYSSGIFQHPKPTTLSSLGPQGGEGYNENSQLKLQDNLEEYLLMKQKNNSQWIKQLNDYGFSKVQPNLLEKLSLQQKQYVLDKFTNIFHLQPKIINKFLITYESQKKKTNQNYKLTSKILSCLTKEQLIELGKTHYSVFTNQDYIELWFNQLYCETVRKYVENSQYFTKEQQQQKRVVFQKIIKELQLEINNYKSEIIKRYLNKLKSEIVVLDTIVNDPCINRFIEYLQDPAVWNRIDNIKPTFAKQFRNILGSNIQPRMRYRLQVDKIIPNTFAEQYIQLLFKAHINGGAEDIIKRLHRFFEDKYLRKIYARVRLNAGEVVQNVNDYFEQAQYQIMKEKKQIRISSSNSKKYKVQDDVELDVSIKNVKKIVIKVYILNLQKHYLGESSNNYIDDEIKLSFLLPTAEQTIFYQFKNSFEVKDVKINLNNIIPKQMGVYIVDFQGETITSRAVIRKGTIICVDAPTQAGQQFSFFDQSGRPLNEQNGLKVWIREQKTPINGNKVFVPYGARTEHGTIVAAIGNYAQTFQKKFEEEKYKFDVTYVYNSQSFSVGKKSKIIIHGRLAINDKPMNLQLIKNIKIRATLTNYQNIKTSFPFQYEKWNDGEDIVIDFPIQAYTKQINITVEGQITLQTKKEVTLNSSKDIIIDLGQNQSNFLDFYLDKDQKNNYRLSLLGANGEPISNVEVNLSYNVTGIEQIGSKLLKTNNAGQINLGKLKIVDKLRAEINNEQSNISRVWDIDQTTSNYNYNKVIHFKLGQQITLPINSKWKEGDVLLLRTFDKFYSEDLSRKLKFENGRLKFPKLEHEGYYILKLLPISVTIEIITLKNIQWQSDTVQNQKVYDEDEGVVYQINKNIYQNIAIKNVQFQSNNDSTNANIVLDLEQVSEERQKQIRVHVLASNYIGPQISDSLKIDTLNTQTKPKQHYIQVKRSAYYSNKTLSDQGSYVWNRQQKKQNLIGNNLQKPAIFLKKILVRQTNQQKQNLNEDGNYIQQCAMMEVDPNIRQRFQMNKSSASTSICPKNNGLNLNSHNNFLLYSGDVSTNKNGNNIKVQIPVGYNSIDIFILTPKTAIKNTYTIGSNKQPSKRDLRHTGLERSQQNSGWTMSREINQLKIGESRKVNRDSQWRTVGLSDIFQFANTKKIKLYDWSNHLLNWSSYDLNKKKEIYDKQCCHELNTFIRFKDQNFFNLVVRDFIHNKVQKTFVDLCLLNHPNYKSYSEPSKYFSLNAFEKSLLVHTLVINGEQKKAESFVNALELQQKAVKRNYQQYKTNFDTIINAKQTEDNSEYKGKQYEAKSKRMLAAAPMMMKCMAMPQSRSLMRMRQEKLQQKKSFVPVESTKQYTQRTYYNVKNYKKQAPSLVSASPFWSSLSRQFLNKNNQIISQNFMYLRNPIEFILAASFISSESSSNFDLQNLGDKYQIKAKSPMLIYIKQVKKIDYQKKFGVLINQRFLDPRNRWATQQDGTQYERVVEEFIIRKSYVCQTVVNNTSGTPLELQILLDIPRGTLPLRSHQYTQILNIRIQPYTSKSYERQFYIPEEGEYELYPSNASRGSIIIAKADTLPPIKVKRSWTINKLQSFEDVLRSGEKDLVLNFLENRNIFDPNIFNPYDILWMLKDRQFYDRLIEILSKRNFFSHQIWNYAFVHRDLAHIKDLVGFKQSDELKPTAFQYFPYYSSRTHQFANESKSTIRNVQFKQSYIRFLLGSTIRVNQGSFEVIYAYYLILQDRLREANNVLNRLNPEQSNNFKIQIDYMRCFLDLSLNAPNFNVARDIIKKYVDYPLGAWKKLFDQVSNTINSQQDQEEDERQFKKNEVFQPQVIQQSGKLKIIQPANSEIMVQVYDINLEVYFSEYPFYQIKTFTSIKPSKVKRIISQDQTIETTISRSDFNDIKDATVEITQIKNGIHKKITSFWWTNPEIKVKINENEGTLQVYHNKKRVAGGYVKVFSDKGLSKDFYRDGYTDMTGTFRYAMSDIEGVREFSLLVMTDQGGAIHRVKPPSKLSSF